MRGLFLTIMALGLIGARTQAQQPMASNDRAYTLTLMCAVVASHDKNDADIQRTMGAVRKMGVAKGYANERVSADLIQAANVLGVELRNNPNSMANNRAICRKLGLVG